MYVRLVVCVCVSSCVLQIGGIYKRMHGYPCIFAVWLVRNSNHAFPSTLIQTSCLSWVFYSIWMRLVWYNLGCPPCTLFSEGFPRFPCLLRTALLLAVRTALAATVGDDPGLLPIQLILEARPWWKQFCDQSTSTCRDSPQHDGTLPTWALRIMEYDEWHDLLYSKVMLYWFMKS